MSVIKPRRIFIFRLIVAAVFAFLLLILFLKGKRLYNSVDRAGIELNNRINNRNLACAVKNTFGFTDSVRTKKKPKGIFRIIVIGDSFVWGDGIPYEKGWSHRLESMLHEAYDSIEVLSWGKQGWSTLDEYNFFKEQGASFQPDILIIGWVDNDPDMGKNPQYAPDPRSTHPILYKIYPALAQSINNQDMNDKYAVWFEALYQPQNLKDYAAMLHEFHQYLEQKNIRALMVITPGPGVEGNDMLKPACDTMEKFIDSTGFTCLNLFDSLKIKFVSYRGQQLEANPVNCHPGEMMHQEYANEVKNYLEANGYLNKLHRRGAGL